MLKQHIWQMLEEKHCVCVLTQSCLTLGNPWTVAYEAPLLWDFAGKNTVENY